ncbi:MAG: hypothetical protein OEV49_11995 [candidate division Zixibacteria bacterium]|nr:hypothetical protein [candidate division Zixibacteria bacterium]MDH3937146.1 hypothetical protein [candidate division Zixibacteria bacterium]MDH4035501.1 hypothetical protein [candidate division Zixibacteria bacterium]
MYNRIPILLCLVICASAFGAGGFDPAADMTDGMGNTVVLAQPSALELLSVPVGGIDDGDFKLESGYSRKFGMKELDRVYLASVRRFGPLTTALGISQFGRSNLYAEKLGRLAVAYNVDSLSLGATISAMIVEFGNGYDNLSGVTVGVGCGYRTRRLKTAIMFENLTTPRLHAGSPEINVVSGLHLELLGPGPYSVTGRVTLEPTEKPQFGLGQKIRLSPRGSFFWGVTTAPRTYGGGVQVSYRSYLITIAASYHSTLGLSNHVALSLVRFGDEKAGR